ncbi:MAG: GNAT family N-acetyltransferase [Pseudonocardiales bacterium]|nr:GNAT family N-acetyltransferase [Pseudonocardiales bacterium]
MGFLVAFISPSQQLLAYLHFIGVRPDQRRLGLAHRLYEKFTDYARRQGRREFACHHRSQQHRLDSVSSVSRFTVSQPVADYHGPGRAMVTCREKLRLARP